MRRVVITGMGAVTPLGNDLRTTWKRLLAGESGVDRIQAFDPSAFPVQIAAEVKDDYDPTGAVAAKELRKLDRNVLFALSAAKEAVGDAGLNGFDPERVGVVVGNCIGGFNELMRQYDVLRDRGPGRVSPTFPANVAVGSAGGAIALEPGMAGPEFA